MKKSDPKITNVVDRCFNIDLPEYAEGDIAGRVYSNTIAARNISEKDLYELSTALRKKKTFLSKNASYKKLVAKLVANITNNIENYIHSASDYYRSNEEQKIRLLKEKVDTEMFLEAVSKKLNKNELKKLDKIRKKIL